MKYSVKHELFLLSHAKDVCICACVIFSVHLGGISHRCMHSSCSENSSSRVIYYPNSPVITAVFVLNTPPTLLQPEQPCPPLANSTTSLGHTVCCSHQDPGAPLFFFYNLCLSPNLPLSVLSTKNSKGSSLSIHCGTMKPVLQKFPLSFYMWR